MPVDPLKGPINFFIFDELTKDDDDFDADDWSE